MARYYVNKNEQHNGDHEVHKLGCSYFPDTENLVYLGDFDSCAPAVEEAKTHYTQSNGCFWCSPDCHTS